MKGYTIYKVNGYCYGKVKDDKHNKYVPVSGRYSTRDECERECIRVRHEINEGLYKASAKMSLKELCYMYFNDYLDPALKYVRESTAYEREHIINKYIINSNIAKTPLHSIDKASVTRFQNEIVKSTPNSPSVPYSVMNILKMLLNFAVDQEIISKRPTIKMPQRDIQEKPVITKDKLYEILSSVDPFNGCAVGIMGLSGLRIGECFGLKITDVDFDHKTINICRRSYRGTIDKPKTRGSAVKLEIDPLILKLIRRWCHWNTGWIFPGQKDKPLNYINWESTHFKKICKDFNLPERFTPHCLRHTFGYHVLLGTKNIMAVKKLMRHRDIKTTLNEYGHYLDEDLRVLLDERSKDISNFKFDNVVSANIKGVIEK